MSVLIQFIHPYPERSRANRALRDAVADLSGVTVNDLYARYPNFHVDIRREQALLAAADLVVFQHPFYWYSGPALLKEWIDLVLAHGYAYGPGGSALRGKHWQHSITTGMPGETYSAEGINQYPIGEFLKPFERTAAFCGMHWLEPLVFHDAHGADGEHLRRHAAELRRRVQEWLGGQGGDGR